MTPTVLGRCYVRDCYELRNDTAHEGRHVTSEQLDAAIAAYDGLRRAVEELTIATAETYPRTAILVHGHAGLEEAGALTGRVEQELKAIQEEKVVAFWLPYDLRVPD
jgi:hypothetical protein